MTKKMNLLIGLAIAATMMLPMTSRLISTKAEVRYNEIDRLFESTITEIFDYEQTEGGAKVEAEKEWLYDINLCELGVLYDFAYKDKEGFAINGNRAEKTRRVQTNVERCEESKT